MTSTRLSPDAYVAHVEADSTRFVEALEQVPPDSSVPTCPGWSAADLLDHLRQVQWRWGRVVADGLTDSGAARALQAPPRPEAYDELLAAARATATDLASTLRDAPPDRPAYSWTADRTAGFTQRRQAHEACIHRLDAELVLAPDGSAITPVDALLAADGVDEALRVFVAACPSWADVTPTPGRTLRVVATDTGTTWLVTLARLTGTDKRGREHDRASVVVAGDDHADGHVRPAAIVSGPAEDLQAWLWGRPTRADLHRTGDPAVLGEFDGVVAATRV